MVENEPVTDFKEKIADQKIDQMLWTEDEKSRMISLLLGDEVETQPFNSSAWESLKSSTDIESDEADVLLSRIDSFLRQNPKVDTKTDAATEDDITGEEYEEIIGKRSKTLADLTNDELVKNGFWTAEESRRVTSGVGFRSGKKTGFSQDNKLGESASGSGIYAAEDGGPNFKSAIFAPKSEHTKRIGDDRVRGSLAHEAAHILRAGSNKHLWEGFEEYADEFELRSSSNLEKDKLIGGYYVGSNKQGSEAVGDLFAEYVQLAAHKSEKPTIVEMRNIITEKLREKRDGLAENIDKYKKGDKKSVLTRYMAARFALAHHLDQLTEAGLGDMDATRLLAIGALGYTSFEKTPELARVGVLNSDKIDRMEKVVNNVSDWLSETE